MPYDEIKMAVIEGKPRLAAKLVQKALEQGESASAVLDRGLLSAMRRMGMNFQSDDQDIARVLACARAMKAGLEQLEPFFEGGRFGNRGKAILGTAGGDLHDVGKNIVAIMFRGCGFEVIDLGVDVSARQFVQAVKAHPDVQVVCISCLLTTSLPEMKHIVQALNEMEIRSRFHVMIGGGPVTEEFAGQIGADAYTDNAVEAAEIAAAFAEKKQSAS
jgi:5-methyltetrahydrofolate--homocysteine methyltransferase